MPLRINEYGSFPSGRPYSEGGIAAWGWIQTQVVTIGSSVSTNTLSSATHMITVDTDSGCTVFIGSSNSTGVAASSCPRIGANLTPQRFYVNPYSRLCTLST